jgi:Flp pilus assembly protein TadD
LLNEKKSSQPQIVKGRKAADVEDLSLPNKAVDEIGRARRSLKENKPEAAIAHLKKAVSIYPQYSKAYNNLGLIYREMGRLPEAETAFLKAVEINPRNQIAQRNLGYLYIAMNHPERAVGPLSEAERLEPADAGAKAFLGDAMFRLGRLNEAEASLKTALQIKPDFYPAAYRLGCLYAQQRKFPEAIALLEQVLKSEHPGLETAGVEKLISKLREFPQ